MISGKMIFFSVFGCILENARVKDRAEEMGVRRAFLENVLRKKNS